MRDQWERLKGKTYPDRLAEQLTALETDETLISYKEAERADGERPVSSDLSHVLSIKHGRPERALPMAGDAIIYSTNSVPKGVTGAIGGIVTPMTWCIGGICHLRSILTRNFTVSAVRPLWKMKGLSPSTTAKNRGIVPPRRRIRFC